MKEVEAFGEYGEDVPSEKDLHREVRRAILGLEVRISLDKYAHTYLGMDLGGEKLTDAEGKLHDVSKKTVERYNQRNYLISQYSDHYGILPEFEAAKKQWRYLTN